MSRSGTSGGEPRRRHLSRWSMPALAALLVASGGVAWRLRQVRLIPVRGAACESPALAREGARTVEPALAPRDPVVMPATAAPARPGGAAVAPATAPPVVGTPTAPIEEDPLVAGNVSLAMQALDLAALAAADAGGLSERAREYEQARRAQEARLVEAGVFEATADGGAEEDSPGAVVAVDAQGAAPTREGR